MSQQYHKVTHCLFDMDGLLLDTEKIYTKITQKILIDAGCPETYAYDFKVQLMGLQSYDVANRVVERYNLTITADDYVYQNRSIAEEWMPSVDFLPGAERLLRHLHKHNIPIALATSSSKEMYDVKTVRHQELFDLFWHKVYGSSDPEVKNGKPAPDIFLTCARRFKGVAPKPEDCLVFEDAPNGVQAACSAGMQSIMIPEDYVPEDMRKKATLVLNSLEEFKPELFGLPPFDD